jgi:nuclease S1
MSNEIHRVRLRLFVCGLATVAVVWSSPAWSWGNTGHEIIATVATDRLTPHAAAAVKELLAGDKATNIVTASTWADAYRRTTEGANTYNWHFVDIPLDATTYDPARDCTLDPRRGTVRLLPFRVSCPSSARTKET